MKNIVWLESWYRKQVISNYKNKYNIEISTTADSGWKVVIDLSKTKFAKLNFTESSHKSDLNKYSVSIAKKKFKGTADFTKLDFLIGKFREIIGENKVVSDKKTDNFFSSKIQNFIFEEEDNCNIFIHYTNNIDFAMNIIKEGFEFLSPFDKTTNSVKNNSVDLAYSHYIRKPYGDYIVILAISQEIYDLYNSKIPKNTDKYIRVEEIICEKNNFNNEDDDEIYTMSNKYIKGFINYKTGDIIKNIEFNPYFNSIIFETRLVEFLNKQAEF